MDNELDILLEIGNKKGTIEKMDYLKENKDNERLKNILYYAFNPFIVFGIFFLGKNFLSRGSNLSGFSRIIVFPSFSLISKI